MTDIEINKNDFAVKLCDNHSFLEAETDDLLVCLDTAMRLDGRKNKSDLQSADLPIEFLRIYEMISGNEMFFLGDEHFIKFDELKTDDHVIVFYSDASKPLAGFDIPSGRLARYDKGGWSIERGDLSFFRFCILRILTNILERRLVVKKGRLKGPIVSSINLERALENNGTGDFHILKELGIYGVVVLFDDKGTIALIRSNGFYGDVQIGAESLQGITDIQDIFNGNLNLLN